MVLLKNLSLICVWSCYIIHKSGARNNYFTKLYEKNPTTMRENLKKQHFYFLELLIIMKCNKRWKYKTSLLNVTINSISMNNSINNHLIIIFLLFSLAAMYFVHLFSYSNLRLIIDAISMLKLYSLLVFIFRIYFWKNWISWLKSVVIETIMWDKCKILVLSQVLLGLVK